jgi:hypothetical protein
VAGTGSKKLSWTFVLNDMRSTPTRIVEIRLSLLKWRAGGATEDKSAVTKESCDAAWTTSGFVVVGQPAP